MKPIVHTLTKDKFYFLAKIRFSYGSYYFEFLSEERMAEILWSKEYTEDERLLFNELRESYIQQQSTDNDLPF